MPQNRKRLTVVLLTLCASALAFSLASACYGTHAFDPNYMPNDSQRTDTTTNQGLLHSAPTAGRFLA